MPFYSLCESIDSGFVSLKGKEICFVAFHNYTASKISTATNRKFGMLSMYNVFNMLGISTLQWHTKFFDLEVMVKFYQLLYTKVFMQPVIGSMIIRLKDDHLQHDRNKIAH